MPSIPQESKAFVLHSFNLLNHIYKFCISSRTSLRSWTALLFAVKEWCYCTDEKPLPDKSSLGRQTTVYPLPQTASSSLERRIARRFCKICVFLCVFAVGGGGVGGCKEVLSSAGLEARGRHCAPSRRRFFMNNDT